MDIGTTIIGVLMILLCSIPFVVFTIKNSNKRKQNFQNLFDVAKENECIISQKEHWNHHILGIDENSKTLFFSVNPPNKQSYSIIRLNEIQQVNCLNNKSNNVLDLIGIELVFSAANQPNLILEFYNASKSFSLSNELELVQKWHSIIARNSNSN